jgi:hypothetical protein
MVMVGLILIPRKTVRPGPVLSFVREIQSFEPILMGLNLRIEADSRFGSNSSSKAPQFHGFDSGVAAC